MPRNATAQPVDSEVYWCLRHRCGGLPPRITPELVDACTRMPRHRPPATHTATSPCELVMLPMAPLACRSMAQVAPPAPGDAIMMPDVKTGQWEREHTLYYSSVRFLDPIAYAYATKDLETHDRLDGFMVYSTHDEWLHEVEQSLAPSAPSVRRALQRVLQHAMGTKHADEAHSADTIPLEHAMAVFDRVCVRLWHEFYRLCPTWASTLRLEQARQETPMTLGDTGWTHARIALDEVPGAPRTERTPWRVVDEHARTYAHQAQDDTPRVTPCTVPATLCMTLRTQGADLGWLVFPERGVVLDAAHASVAVYADGHERAEEVALLPMLPRSTQDRVVRLWLTTGGFTCSAAS